MIHKIKENIFKFADKTAFVIKHQAYSYRDFGEMVGGIMKQLSACSLQRNEVVALSTSDTLETYAAIVALWFSGHAFVPINKQLPLARVRSILQQAKVSTILYQADLPSHFTELDVNKIMIDSKERGTITLPADLLGNDLMYVLFTSGSTGVPKGVPISRDNLDAFVDAFFSNDYELNEEDRFLQMFDFGFDVSVQCYVLPLVLGASIHTVDFEDVKFLSIYQVLREQKITIAKMVPSVIGFLRPYFNKIRLPDLKYSLFSGEALNNNILAEWSKCAPNAVFQNYYGPTEATIDCLYYTWNPADQEANTYNGTVSIGHPFGKSVAIIVDEKGGRIIGNQQKGELCIAGPQLTTGYLGLTEKNAQSFFSAQVASNTHRFYRTGDIVFRNEAGAYMYCGRLDHQVQVQGHRVELGEIEFHAQQVAGGATVAAIAKEGTQGVSIFLFIEGDASNLPKIKAHLNAFLPKHMLPYKIIFTAQMPLTSSGKIDRNQLTQLAL